MFSLIIKKSKSKNFNKAIDCAIELGGTYNGKEIVLNVDEDLHIYDKVFPLLKYNVTNWVGTTAFFNEKEVHPYRFMLQKHLSIKIAVSYVVQKLYKVPPVSKEYQYYNRVGNTFFFKNDDFSFDVELKGKELYVFLENYELGDIFIFDGLTSFM